MNKTRPRLNSQQAGHVLQNTSPFLNLKTVTIVWTVKEDKLLGTAHDEQIARRIHRSEDAVRARRNILGIPAWNVSYSKPWTSEEDAFLGVVPDRVLAKRLKRTFLAVQARREIKQIPPVNPQRQRSISWWMKSSP